jgi:hypothetical protein
VPQLTHRCHPQVFEDIQELGEDHFTNHILIEVTNLKPRKVRSRGKEEDSVRIGNFRLMSTARHVSLRAW